MRGESWELRVESCELRVASCELRSYGGSSECQWQICSPAASLICCQWSLWCSTEESNPSEIHPSSSRRFRLRLLITDTSRVTSASWNSVTCQFNNNPTTQTFYNSSNSFISLNNDCNNDRLPSTTIQLKRCRPNQHDYSNDSNSDALNYLSSRPAATCLLQRSISRCTVAVKMIKTFNSFHIKLKKNQIIVLKFSFVHNALLIFDDHLHYEYFNSVAARLI